MGKAMPEISEEVILLLSGYSFPGNVRELRALAIDAMSRYVSGPLGTDCFRQVNAPVEPEADLASSPVFPRQQGALPTIKQAISELVLAALDQTGGNRTAAAKILGISQPALSKRLKNMDSEED
jgi:DNA-binding NtrC family response regulator